MPRHTFMLVTVTLVFDHVSMLISGFVLEAFVGTLQGDASFSNKSH